MLKLNRLRLDQILLCHQALLLHFEVHNSIFEIADLFVQEVT